MSTTWVSIRRQVAMEMNLWGGATDGTAGPATFSTNADSTLTLVFDVTRPESDDDWNGSWMCINPGNMDTLGSVIWRRIAEDQGYVNASGKFTLTAALPGASYGATGVHYELFKVFNPEQWMAAANYALRKSYPHRHRTVPFEFPEDPGSAYIDWGRFVAALATANPVTGPTMSVVGDAASTWATGTYLFAYSYFNDAGETKVSSTTSQAVTAGQSPQFAAITIPEQAVGVRYYAVRDPGGSQLAGFTTGNGSLGAGAPAGSQLGLGSAAFVVPAIVFSAAPTALAPMPPSYNTTALDVVKLNGMKRRLNPGRYPEQYMDLSPNYWREAGGTTVKLEYGPLSPNYSIRLECIAPALVLTVESDTTTEPLEVLISGSMVYLWNLLLATSSAQNTQVWQVEATKAEKRFTDAKSTYNLAQPRRTVRRPAITINRWGGPY